MFHSPIGKKELILSLLVGFSIVIIQIVITFYDTRTKIVFCDVGQGDGAYIRIHNRFDVVIDAGPDRKILNCLGKYIPFYDRRIELAIISHPQKDHFGGFLYLLDRYQIEKMLMTPLNNTSQSFKRLKEKLVAKEVTVNFPKAGRKIKILDDSLMFYWPTDEFLTQNITYAKRPLRIGIDNVLGVSTVDDNNFSLVMFFQEGNFRVLFTGDASPRVLNEIASSLSADWRITPRNDRAIMILKVPHHGSKNGLTEKFLRLANPSVAVISVGKKNAYGHPSKEILDMLRSHKVKIKRTDEDGDVVFKIPNYKFQIPNNVK